MSKTVVRLTRRQVREVDRRAIEQYHVPGIMLMENAAIHAAQVAWEMVAKQFGERIDVVCGGGNNGGDGLAVARHLHNRGAVVDVILAVDPEKYTGDALINWRIVQAMGLRTHGPSEAAERLRQATPALTVDAVFGTGLSAAPREDSARLIELINAKGLPVLAIDLPSGLDCDTGEPLGGACVRATRTVTFVAEKAGFANPNSRQYTGEVVVADIGCPRDAISDVLRDIPADAQ
ncbi:MAG TPA: NAD(P)H-hydrate epimerase [Tepidisphaeraceae bacterium]|jgi:NAD(P)H-hydrate epimerase